MPQQPYTPPPVPPADTDSRKKEMNKALTPDKEQTGSLIGTGAGIAAGAAIGSVVPGIGTVAGAVVGGIIGAVGGGLTGLAIGHAIDVKEYEAYWQKHYVGKPYARDMTSEDMMPAYRYGWETRGNLPKDARWEDYEQKLGSEWGSVRAGSRLEWDDARLAARDAWDRVDHEWTNKKA